MSETTDRIHRSFCVFDVLNIFTEEDYKYLLEKYGTHYETINKLSLFIEFNQDDHPIEELIEQVYKTYGHKATHIFTMAANKIKRIVGVDVIRHVYPVKELYDDYLEDSFSDGEKRLFIIIETLK